MAAIPMPAGGMICISDLTAVMVGCLHRFLSIRSDRIRVGCHMAIGDGFEIR